MKNELDTRPMKIEHFLAVMEQNEKFYPEYAKLSLEDKIKVAQLNIDTGIAESHYIDGKLIGVTGIRYRGIGEAWFIVNPEIRANKFLLFKRTQKTLPRMRDAIGIWRLYATSKISENFLKHLGYEPEPTMFCWTRTE